MYRGYLQPDIVEQTLLYHDRCLALLCSWLLAADVVALSWLDNGRVVSYLPRESGGLALLAPPLSCFLFVLFLFALNSHLYALLLMRPFFILPFVTCYLCDCISSFFSAAIRCTHWLSRMTLCTPNRQTTRCKHYFCESCALKQYGKSKKCFACSAETWGMFNAAQVRTLLVLFVKTHCGGGGGFLLVGFLTVFSRAFFLPFPLI